MRTRCVAETAILGKISRAHSAGLLAAPTKKEISAEAKISLERGCGPRRARQASGGSTMRLAADSWKVGASTSNSAGRVTNTVTRVLS